MLSQVPYAEIQIGDRVLSAHLDPKDRVKGTITEKRIGQYPSRAHLVDDLEEQCVVINWDNGRFSDQPSCFLDRVAYLGKDQEN